MKMIALTGNIAGGKTTALNIIKSFGIPTISCDEIYHKLIKTDKTLIKKLIKYFGNKILAKDGTVDTNKLRNLLKLNPEEILLLEKITHPIILKQVDKLTKKLQKQKNKIVVVDVPLLFEKNLEKKFDVVITVYCTKNIQKNRLLARGVNPKEIKFLLSRQLPIKEKLNHSHYKIFNNTNSVRQLAHKLKKIFSIIFSKHLPKVPLPRKP